jgi:serine/threonine protein phosphatase PrpC
VNQVRSLFRSALLVSALEGARWLWTQTRMDAVGDPDHATTIESIDCGETQSSAVRNGYGSGRLGARPVSEAVRGDSGPGTSAMTQDRSTHQRGGLSRALGSLAYGFAEDTNERYRRTNEDGHSFISGFAGRDEDAFFAIYDGHGGREAVSEIERRFHEVFAEELFRERQALESSSGPPSTDRVRYPERCFHRAYARMDSELETQRCLYVGSTSITCLLRRDELDGCRYLHTANAGDSRAILIRRDGHAVRLSYDHKASDENEARRVSDSGGFVACRRVLGVLAVSRALGDFAMKHVVISEPYTSTHPVQEGIDTHVVLACDGLFDVLSDEQVAQMILNDAQMRENAQHAAERLVRRALEEGSTDNISCLVVKLA